jgi:Tfp pilus assembly protein PilE
MGFFTSLQKIFFPWSFSKKSRGPRDVTAGASSCWAGQKGFTLVELCAIIAVVASLLYGVFYLAQNLMENSRIMSCRQQVLQCLQSVETFQEKYGGLPGMMTSTKTLFQASQEGKNESCSEGLAPGSSGAIAWVHLEESGCLPPHFCTEKKGQVIFPRSRVGHGGLSFEFGEDAKHWLVVGGVQESSTRGPIFTQPQAAALISNFEGAEMKGEGGKFYVRFPLR